MVKAKALIPVCEDPYAVHSGRPRSSGSLSEERRNAGELKSSDGLLDKGKHSQGPVISSPYVGKMEPRKVLDSLLWNPRCMMIQEESQSAEIPESVLSLAEEMLDAGDLIEDVVDALRKSIPSKKYQFTVSVDHRSKEEQKRLSSLLNSMTGVIANVYLSTGRPTTISGRLIGSSRTQAFITGRYVEFALYNKARRIVERIAREHDVTGTVFRNVMITNPENVIINEFDLVIVLGGELYIIEIKSGKNFSDFDKYIQIVANYRLEDRFLLVTGTLGKEQIERIEYFCGYAVCGIDGHAFEERLEAMLVQGLKNQELARMQSAEENPDEQPTLSEADSEVSEDQDKDQEETEKQNQAEQGDPS